MTITKRSRKQTFERYFIAGSILRVQEDGTEKIVLGSSSIIAVDKDGADVSATLLDQTTKRLDNDPKGGYEDNLLSIRVRDGDPDVSPYKVTFYMETTKANRFEVDMRVGVGEI